MKNNTPIDAAASVSIDPWIFLTDSSWEIGHWWNCRSAETWPGAEAGVAVVVGAEAAAAVGVVAVAAVVVTGADHTFAGEQPYPWVEQEPYLSY